MSDSTMLLLHEVSGGGSFPFQTTALVGGSHSAHEHPKWFKCGDAAAGEPIVWWCKNMVLVPSSIEKPLPMKVLDVWNPDGKLQIITMIMFKKEVSVFSVSLLPYAPLQWLDDTHKTNAASGLLFTQCSVIVLPLDSHGNHICTWVISQSRGVDK